MSSSETNNDTTLSIEAQRLKPSSTTKHVTIIPFCVPLPQNTELQFNFDDQPSSSSSSNKKTTANTVMDSSRGVVGTITLANSSAIIWFGWGTIVPTTQQQQKQESKTTREEEEEKGGGDGDFLGDQQIGKGLPQMGPMAVSMPRSNYNSSSSTSIKEAPSSQLIGGANEEDMLTGIQISSRLSSKVNWPIFVSCAIHSDLGGGAQGGGEGGMGGLGAGYGGMLSQRAAALAEKEIGRILLMERKKRVKS